MLSFFFHAPYKFVFYQVGVRIRELVLVFTTGFKVCCTLKHIPTAKYKWRGICVGLVGFGDACVILINVFERLVRGFSNYTRKWKKYQHQFRRFSCPDFLTKTPNYSPEPEPRDFDWAIPNNLEAIARPLKFFQPITCREILHTSPVGIEELFLLLWSARVTWFDFKHIQGRIMTLKFPDF